MCCKVYTELKEVDLMFTAICFVLFLVVFFKLFGVALKVGWGIFKIAICLVLFPAFVIALIFGGLAFIALPIILIGGIVGLVAQAA